MASAATNAIAPPSSFAALLRRSKFATFDPRIGQVYATHGGHAHRGDWGIKRQLANRRRDARITLQSIDTIYQQTEWKSAYNDAIWMKKFEEMGATPDVHLSSKWYFYAGEKTLEWHVDSDYAPRMQDQTKGEKGPAARGGGEAEAAPEYYNFSLVPNTAAMNEQQFRGYIKRLRTKRQEFQHFIKAESGGDTSTQHYEFSRMAKTMDKRHLQFVSKQVQADANVRKTALRVPHATAGLSYTHAPPLQQFFYKPALPGHRLEIANDKSPYEKFTVTAHTAVAGFLGDEPITKNGDSRTTDLGTIDGDPRTIRDSGRGYFRPSSCVLWTAPSTVGKEPEPLDKATFDFKFQSIDESRRRNPHPPGSREYIAFDQAAHFKSRPSMSKAMTHQSAKKASAMRRVENSANNPTMDMLNRIGEMVKANKDAQDGEMEANKNAQDDDQRS